MSKFDQIALDVAREIEAIPADWPAVRRKARTQVLIIEALERLVGERERLWCQACGTVTRDKTCDCNRYGKTDYEPNFVNYADQLGKDAKSFADDFLAAEARALAAEAAIKDYLATFDRCGGSEAVSAAEFAEARGRMRGVVAGQPVGGG